MRIVTWNCQGGFRNKTAALATLKPDLAIIQECESPERLRAASPDLPEDRLCWHGDSSDKKGVAAVAFSDYQVTIDAGHDPSIKYVVPIHVGGAHTFRLLAVWTKEDAEKKAMYIGQAMAGVGTYTSFIGAGPTMVVGDFNSNQSWDRPDVHLHADVVAELADHGLASVYHYWYREPPGAETRNTFYMHRKRERGFHIDYCFIPRTWLPYVRSVQVGAYQTWSQHSDHCPIVVDIDFDHSIDRLQQRILQWGDRRKEHV